jgi:predicted dinucleotide-binding enzyme
VVANYGESLAGKILVDISNPFNADASGLVTTTGNSAAQIAAAAPEGTRREGPWAPKSTEGNF